MPSRIEWTDETWNPVTGCTPVSAGCANCYAARMAKRLRGRFGYPADEPFRVTVHPDRIEEPRHWKKPRMVFVCSMGDLFHDDVPQDAIFAIYAVMMQHPEHTFQVLTKRPDRARVVLGLMAAALSVPFKWPPANIWQGVTAENQATADERIPLLLQTPAAVRFVSLEPLLGLVDLTSVRWTDDGVDWRANVLTGEIWCDNSLSADAYVDNQPRVDWVIVGGETGPGARPMKPEWAWSIHDQCEAAGLPFFFKGWGCWGDSRSFLKATRLGDWRPQHQWPGGSTSWKLGRKAAGRLLDGVEHNEYPQVKVDADQ